jgi:hypothetical protein
LQTGILFACTMLCSSIPVAQWPAGMTPTQGALLPGIESHAVVPSHEFLGPADVGPRQWDIFAAADKADEAAARNAARTIVIVVPRLSPPEDQPLRDAVAVAQPVPELSRRELCSTVASVAAENSIPVPFFANLIWQESGFKSHVVSPAGAQGIAQFMPDTASRYGLDNPFDPIRALAASARFLRELIGQFGNVGLAAAAYNAGPKRVQSWMAKKSRLPAETRNYVQAITGRPAEQWAQAKATTAHLPAKAPCVEVVQAIRAQVQAEAKIAAETRLETKSVGKAKAVFRVASAESVPVQLPLATTKAQPKLALLGRAKRTARAVKAVVLQVAAPINLKPTAKAVIKLAVKQAVPRFVARRVKVANAR